MMRFIVLMIALLGLTFIFCTCKNHATQPPPPSGPDTTSNNFTWQTFTFGGNAGSCVLHDVAIISDTNIWTVGEVYLDSVSGNPDPFPYNAAHWDGTAWKLIKIPFYYQEQAIYTPIYSIFAFSTNNIWFEYGIHWDGSQFNSVPLNIDFPSHANKMFGTSNGYLYFVGNTGLIGYRNANGTPAKIPSGTSLDFVDIYGSNGQILAVCTQNYPTGRGIFSLQGNTATQISSSSISQLIEFFSVWFVPNEHYYVVGDGIYEKNLLSDSTWKNGPLDITHYATTSVRGNGVNDVFVVGAFGEFLHWNGVRWVSFITQTSLPYGSYASVAVSGNLIVAVGANSPQAVITMGRRQ